MKIVPLFLLSAFFFARLLAETRPALSAELSACGLSLDLPASFALVQKSSDSLRAQTEAFPRWNLIAYCAQNQFKTDRNEATLAEYRSKGDYLRGKEEVELPGGYSAVVLRRTPASGPVQRIEAFFSTREFIYHFVLVPENRHIPPEDWKRMQETLTAALGTVEVQNQKPAITERAYTMRLLISAGVSLAFFCAALWLLLKRVVRRNK